MLRKRKTRRYNETEEGDGVRKFNIQDQIKSKRFDPVKGKHLQELSGETFTLRLIQKNGFDKPILIQKPDKLNLKVPQKSFQVKDVRNCVGHERIIDVMDVKTQKNIEMSMKDWCKYYESKNREKLLNVISLEFSHTKLDELVEAPLIVRLLDWVDLVWPKFLKQSQTESTNSIDKMKYPKVQKYCLMSVKGSYTDFHIDFGGTSVWYHILRGKKIFWMVPPTELNLQTFEEWTLSGMQQDVFFGDTVEECFRVELTAGNTFFIPSGWIHAVYTLEDSLVFGGNFLHSFGIENQLKVSKIEDATRVPVKFRYPFYTEILWYVVQHYVHCLTGKDHLQRPDLSKISQDETLTNVADSSPEKTASTKKNKSIESEDEVTASDSDEHDKKNAKRKINKSRKRSRLSNRRTTRSKRARKLSPVKKADETEDESEDSSTEIDSSNEDTKPTEKVTTCRMTKNSLLRLQYEVDEQQNNQLQATQSKDTHNKSKSSSLNKGASSQDKTSTLAPAVASASKSSPTVLADDSSATAKQTGSTINLAEMILDHEASKLNGWGAGAVTTGNLTTWSSNVEVSEPRGPPKIYVTKYEITGLKLLVKHLGKLSGAKKHLPALIRNSRALLDDCRKMIVEHENDDPELAITGKPITLDSLNVRKSDINDLIGQFFKPKLTTSANNDSSNTSPNSAHRDHELSSSNQQKSKFIYLDPSLSDRIKGATTSMSHQNDATALTSPKSPDKKETKCLSSNKKSLSNPTSDSATPPRAKSPPTRPISNNQYTSKTKSNNTPSNNNLLLPGSFADLIAATSTEKKVFDVSGTDIASSLFGAAPSTSPQKGSARGKHNDNQNSPYKISPKVSDLLDRPDALAIPTKSSLSANTSTASTESNLSSSNDQANAHPNSSGTNSKSPEPPKPVAQKRFINPSFKPQNKEKLIFASAPYVSPVQHQARSNDLHLWQTHSHCHMSMPNRPPMSSSGPSALPVTQDSGLASPKGASVSVQAQSHHQQTSTPYTPEATRVSSQAKEVTPSSSSATKPTRENHSSESAQRKHLESNVTARRDDAQSNLKTVIPPTSQPGPSLASTEGPNANMPSQSSSPTKLDTSSKSKPSEVSEPSGDQKAKKQTKPRGPPKKSKEARQVLEQSEPPAVPVSVIKVAPSTSGAGHQTFPAQAHTMPQVFQPPPVATAIKPAKTTKRSKKQKASEAQPVPPTLGQQQATFIANQQLLSQTATAGQQSLFGFVAPPTSSSGLTSISTPAGISAVKVSQPSYLLSRPFLFNAMPTLSTAQLQPGLMNRPSLRMISTSIPSSMGLPTTMQQGARIVWATQPQRFAPTLTAASNSNKTGQIPKPNQQTTTAKAPSSKVSTSSTASSSSTLATSSSTLFSPATTSQSSNSTNVAPTMSSSRTSPTKVAAQPDNAALLSLATTALSTAPMISNPPLGGFANRPGTSQAIMVSTASSHPAMFAGQHLFSPLMQRLPMAPIVTAARPGAPRPTGQLVFARLPTQGLYNQPRFLITQPGFIPQRMQAPSLVPGQSTQTLAFAPYKPPTAQPKAVKTKKVRTN